TDGIAPNNEAKRYPTPSRPEPGSQLRLTNDRQRPVPALHAERYQMA
ncbi:hypothetical protein THAOC_27106, partial [Thalassiosira oceanica]